MSGGNRAGAGRPPGTTKPDSEKRKRIPMTTIKPENHKYLIGLKSDGFPLSKIFDEMIERHKAGGLTLDLTKEEIIKLSETLESNHIYQL